MKNMKFLILFCTACLVFTSCDKTENSAEPSKVTFLPLITIEGETNINLACDATSYTDAGAMAQEAGQDIALTTTVNARYFGSSEVNGPDAYDITYSAENKDGIPGAATRSVLWPECNGDLVTSVAGMYISDIFRNGASPPGYQGIGPIIIKDLGNNEYALSDAHGGWYEYGRALGIAYTETGATFTANDIPSNDYTFGPPVDNTAFGGSTVLTSIIADPVNKTLVITADWRDGAFIFEAHLTQIQ